ncbi:FAD-dependent oxidoreductase [Streptomyces radicis]|nr:FAD-dependent oxidoreductase [Streptomyces radicis]
MTETQVEQEVRMSGADTHTDVVVVGGGIAGLAGALALSRNGQRVTLLEKADEFGEVGAGLQMAPNASRVLDRWGLLNQVREVGFSPRHLVFRDALTGQELTRQSFGRAFEERYGAPYVVVHRSDLHTILLDACRDAGVTLINATVITGTRTEAGRGVATADDGREYAGHLLIGADGLDSTLRAQIAADPPVVSGYVAYRGTVPITRDTASGDLHDVVVHLGPECHLVQYPLRQGDLLNTVAVYRSASFERGEEQLVGSDELQAAYVGCVPAVHRALSNLRTGFRWPMYDREPTDTWRDGRMLLLGDAAHPMLQYLAQGACQAMEDAAALERVTAGVDLADESRVDAALSTFVAERAPRTARVQRTARVWGDVWHVGGVGRVLRNKLFSSRADGDLEVADWLYGGQPAVGL